jgi:hypothetical protein
MDETQYVEERLEDQIRWYSRKSRSNKNWYQRLRAVEIVAAVSIPFLAGYLKNVPITKVTVGLLGLLVAAITGLVSLYRFQELWIEYRTTVEFLKHEKFLFQTKTQPYDAEEAFALLVQRVEELISKEHTGWRQYTKRPENKEES